MTPEPTRDVRVGQVISYHIPVGDHHVQTHRVIERASAAATTRSCGRRATRTTRATRGPRGCNGDDRLAASGAVVPKAGWAIVWLRSPVVRTIAIFAVPLLLALFGLLADLARSPDGESNEDQDAPPMRRRARLSRPSELRRRVRWGAVSGSALAASSWSRSPSRA